VTKGIVHLVSSLHVGGAEKFVCCLARQQIKQGEEVTILSFGQTDDPFQQQLADSGIAIINIQGSLWSRSRQLLQLRQFHTIHIHSPAVIRALLPICPWLWGRNCVYTIHGEVDPPQSLMKLSHQAALSYLKRISAVSGAARQSVRQRYGWEPSRIEVIANGIALPEPGQSTAITNKLRLGVVSRFIPLKNLSLLLQALAALPAECLQQLELHWFGDGPCRAELESMAANLPQLQSTFYGNVQDEQAIFQCFDVLVMCSDSEGLPMSVIEAMGYSKPVIATDVGAIHTVVQPGQTGWLYPARDQQALSAIVQSCVQQPELVRQLGQQARQRIAEHYSIEVVAAEFAAFYQGAGRD
jgi:glycosyltransferase involved in cell wall biosynthesis